MTSSETKRWRMLTWELIHFVFFKEDLTLFSYHLAYEISLKNADHVGMQTLADNFKPDQRE